MTEMRRITIALPEEMDLSILNMRKEDAYIRCSHSEMIRRLVAAGLEALAAEKKEK